MNNNNNNSNSNNNKQKFVRINHHINAPQVRLAAEDGTSEIISLSEALRRSNDKEVDLVEVVPNAKPPVVKIMDYGKWRFEENIRKKEDLKKTKSVAPKEIQLRYCIGDHDVETKVRALKKFLIEKRQVRLVMKFKNRELPFKQIGEKVIDTMVIAVNDLGELQNKPRLEGKNLVAHISPR